MGRHLHERSAGRAGWGGPTETVHSLPHVSVANEEKPEVEVNVTSAGRNICGAVLEKIKPTDDPRVHSFAAGALGVGERPSNIWQRFNCSHRLGGHPAWTGLWNIGAKVKAGACATG